MESPFQSLVKCYVHGIIRRAQGSMNPFEMHQFLECRKAIKQGLETFEWLLMGFDGHVINVVMQMGDRFLGDGNVEMALAFYREASHMFPQAGICYIRETQCHVVLKCFAQAKRACRKAIRHCDDSDFNQLYSIVDMFIENNSLQEAHDLYVILMDRFPHRYQVPGIVQELITLLRDKAEESKKEIQNKKKKNASKGPSGIKKTTSENIGQTSNEKLGEATGGTDPSETVDIAQSVASAKVVKTSKQLKREQMAREREIEREIEKAGKKQEEERKKQEVEARKRKEREEEEEKLRKQEEVEARERKEREEHEKKLEKQKNDEIKKQQRGTSEIEREIEKASKKQEEEHTGLLPKKLSLNDMSTAYDLTLSSGSQFRRVCSTCNTPRVFSYNQRNCHSCRSELVVWYKRVNTTCWVRPRMPPNQDIAGRYVQCKHFLQGKHCVKTPCAFAHGEDELEIWELCRVKKARKQAPHSPPMAEAQTTPVEPDQIDDGWIEVGRRKKPRRMVSEELNRENGGKNKKNKKKATSSATTTSSQDFDTTVLLVKEQEKLRCEFCKITFSSMLQLEYHYSDPQHRVNVMKKIQQFNAKSYTKFRPPPDGVYMGRYKLCRRFEQGYCYFGNKCTFAHGEEECTYWKASYQLQAQQLAQFQEKRLLTENFSENVWRRIKHEGEHRVLKENLPGVTVNCSSPLRVKLNGPHKDGPQNHKWIFDVRIQKKYRVLLREVAFLLETHLDKFKFRRDSGENCSSNMQSIQLLEEDFVENSAKQESAVQFCVQFSSHVFGDFQQKLVFDFGHAGSVLARSLYVLVMSEDICSSKEEPSSRTRYCRILEWSAERMELILCKDLMGLDLDGLCEQYSIPNDLPAYPAEFVEFTRETYCKVWHDILFIEEQHIQMEVARYDIQNGAMKIVNSFQSVDETVFARPGEVFGEIYLSDYLVMDEVAGHLINHSVTSVILRPKVDHPQSNRVYECSIKLKTSQLVIIKLNEVLCKDYVFVKDQEIYIDVKFRYNRRPMCEMHQAIDMFKEKTKLLLPNVKNVSYTDKKSIHDWLMDRKPNRNQHKAIAVILDPSPTPPILVIGPFGTGKTFTLSLACVSILSQPERNKVNKVLICTHSNSAATIHLQYLDEKIAKKPLLNIRPLRVYNLLRKVRAIPEKLRKYCLIEETTNGGEIKEPSWNEIRDHNVIITTLVSARMLWKYYQDGRLRFTHILIDQATQALEPECVTPLVMADENTKIVLAGDHKQMGPRVYSKCLRAEDVGPKRSLLERLFTHYKNQCNKTSSQPSSSLDYKSTFLQIPYLVLLTENYCCHAQILEFPSDCFYGGKLIARGDQSTHELVPVLSFYAAQGVDNRDEGSLAYYNDAEVAEVVKRVEELVHLWPKDWSKSIGIVTPYHDQVKRIRAGLRKKGLGYVDVEMVENVQGKEFKALFISTVRTMWTCSQIEGRNIDEDPSELDFAFLSDPRFLNTAVTRAQSLLAVVGDPMSLCSVGECRNLWKEYLQRCDANKGLYGCTLKTVMDFCFRSQALDPSVHEFTPNKNVQDENNESLKTTSSKEPPDDSSDYFSGQGSEYAESVASNQVIFEIPDHCSPDPFETAFLSQEKQYLSDDCTEYLQRLDWVEDFYKAEANEECKTCHLEIVCKFGKVPRVIDIVQHFGEDVLPFVTYKAKKGTKLDCFINQDGTLKDEFDTALRSIDWVESYKTGVVITCKDDNVPSTGDLSRKISKDILPYVEFTNTSKQVESQESDEESESDSEECTESGSDDEESDEEPESDSEECTDSGSDDEEQNVEQDGKVDEEKIPISSDHEDVSSPSWFESTVLTSDYEVKKEHKEELRRLGWVKACAVGVPNEEHDGLHLLLFCKNGKMPCMAQLKKWFGVKIVSYVEFMAEITDFKFEMNHNRHSESSDGESSLGESSLGESSLGESSLGESSAPEQCQAMCVMSGDGIYEEKQGSNGYGTVGFFVRTNNNPDKFLLATCYHVCYRGKKLPKNKRKAHKKLCNDSKNKKSPTRKGSFWSLNRRKRKEEQRQKDVEERNEGKVPEQKKGTEGYVEMEINKKDCSNTTANVVPEGPEKKVSQSDNLNMQKKDNTNGEQIEVDENCKDDRERDEQKQNFDKRQEQKTMKPEGKTKERKFEEIKLGPYSWGKYDDEHDICFVEQSPDAKCECLTPDVNPKMPILNKREFLHNSKQAIKEEIKSGSRVVEKSGYTTETRKGQLLGFGYCDLSKRSGKDDALLVKDKDRNQPFSLPGDSGSLVSLVTQEDKRIPIAYLKQLATVKKNGGGKRNLHFCLCLVDLIKTCREDKKVGELQLHLTGCAYNGPAFEMKYE